MNWISRDLSAHRTPFDRQELRVRVALFGVLAFFGLLFTLQGLSPVMSGYIVRLRSNVEVVTYRSGVEVSRSPTRAPVVAFGLFSLLWAGVGIVFFGGAIYGVWESQSRRHLKCPIKSDEYVWAVQEFVRRGVPSLATELCAAGSASIERELKVLDENIRHPTQERLGFWEVAFLDSKQKADLLRESRQSWPIERERKLKELDVLRGYIASDEKGGCPTDC